MGALIRLPPEPLAPLLVKAVFGAVYGLVAFVAHAAGGVVPVWAVVHPAGGPGTWAFRA